MKRLAPTAACLMLLACSSGEEGNEQGSATTAKDGGSAIRPGLWESSVEGKVAGMPEMPPATSRACLTEEDLRESEDVFLKDVARRHCSRRDLTMRAGRISGDLDCTQDGTETHVKVSGSFTATSYDVETSITGRVAGADEPMNLQSRTRARRIGECTAAGT